MDNSKTKVGKHVNALVKDKYNLIMVLNNEVIKLDNNIKQLDDLISQETNKIIRVVNSRKIDGSAIEQIQKSYNSIKEHQKSK